MRDQFRIPEFQIMFFFQPAKRFWYEKNNYPFLPQI